MENFAPYPDADNSREDVSHDQPEISSPFNTEIALIDEQGWEFIRNGDDPRVIATVLFAEQLALYAQSYLHEGKTISEAWMEAVDAADASAITPDMEYKAIRMLVKHWAYGTQLHELLEDADESFFATKRDKTINPPDELFY